MVEQLLVILFWLSLAILFYCYLGYGLIALIFSWVKKLLIRHKKNPGTGEMFPVTIIITAYNEETILEKKILNLKQLDYPSDLLKIIFVTDGSSDQSTAIISNYPDIQLLHDNQRKGKYAAIKRAMKLVKSPFVVFSDANTLLNPDSLKKMMIHYEDPRIGGVAGEKKIIVNKYSSAVGEGEGLYWQYESFMKKLDADLFTVIGAAGELFSIRTALFHEFSDELIIDDFVISMQVCLQGYRIAYEPLAFASELPSASLAEEEKRKVRISAGAYQSIYYLKDCLNFWQHPVLSFQYISRRLLRWLFCPVMLLVFFISNGMMVVLNPLPFYNSIFLIQLVFYMMTFTGWALIRQTGKAGIFTVPFYFVFMNYCLIKGFIKFLKGRQSVLWEKSLRQAL